jgi:hypothetical protein
MNEKIRGDYRLLCDHIDRLQRLIDRHRQEPGFAISFDPELFYSLPEYHGLPLVEILFCQFFDHEHPSHVICADGEKWWALPEKEFRRRYGEPRYRQLATFVQPGTDYMVFRYGQRYYGLHWQEGRFHTERTDYRRFVEGDSVEEVLRQVRLAGRRPKGSRRTPAPSGVSKAQGRRPRRRSPASDLESSDRRSLGSTGY